MKFRHFFVLNSVFFLLLTAVFFAPTLFFHQVPLPTDVVTDYLLGQPPSGQNVWVRDSVVQLYPYAHAVFQSWKHGQVPGWIPDVFGGLDLAATGQADIWNPFNVLIIFFANPLSFFAAKVVWYFFLSGWGMSAYVYSRRPNGFLAILGGVMFAFMAPLMVWQAWGTIVGVIAWMPLILLVLEQFFQTKKSSWLILLTVSLLTSVASGHVQFFLYVVAFCSCYGVWLLIQQWRTLSWKSGLWLLFSLLITGVGLVALALPVLQAATISHRATIQQVHGLFFENILQWFLPTVYGDTSHFKGPLNFLESSGYIGVMPLILLISISSFKRPWLWVKQQLVWIISLFIVVPLAFFPLLLHPLFLIFPSLQSFPPSRLVFLIDFLLIILSTEVLQQWIHDRPTIGHFFKTTGVGTICLLSLPLVLLVLFDTKPWSLLYAQFFVSVGMVFVLLLLYVNKKYSFRVFCSLLLVFALLDQGYFFGFFTPQQSRTPLEQPPAYVTYLQHQSLQPPLIYSEVSPVDLYLLYGIHSIFGYDSLYPQAYYELIQSHAKKIISDRNILNARITDYDFLRTLGVQFIVTKRELPVLPKVFSGDGVNVYQLGE